MKTEIFELPVSPLEGYAQSPAVSALQIQKNGDLLVGLSFAKSALLKLTPPVSGSKTFEKTEDLEIDAAAGGDVVAVVAGLRHTTSGDTAFCLLHTGFLPEFLAGFFGGPIRKKKGAELIEFLDSQNGGMGLVCRHSVVQIIEGQLSLRRSKEPGMLWDTAHIGDSVFGLTGTSIWREPYLNSEKRETLRSDLGFNYHLHRDEDGNFWFVGQNARLLRMVQTDIKAKPTPLKLPDDTGFFLSAASVVDGWLYGSCAESKTLVRIRRNQVTFEEEFQVVASFETPITGLLAVEKTDNSAGFLLLALQGKDSVELRRLELVKAEDPELVPAVPKTTVVGNLAGISCVSALTLVPGSQDKAVIWAGEGCLGWEGSSNGTLRLLRISDV